MAPTRSTAPGLPPFRLRDDLPCLNADPELWFDGNTDIGRGLCRRCPVKQECLLWGINNESHGIWGGRSPAERRYDASVLDVRGDNTAPPRPRRLPEQWGWPQAKAINRDMLLRSFAAAHDYVGGGGSVRDVSARHGVGHARLADTTLVLRHAPYLEADVVDGWVQFGVAYGHARDMRDHNSRGGDMARAA